MGVSLKLEKWGWKRDNRVISAPPVFTVIWSFNIPGSSSALLTVGAG